MKTLQLRIFGKVQGVFFRATAKKMAQKLEIECWPQNEADGSVLIRIQGEEAPIDQFIKWCRQGPPLAKVEKVEIISLPSPLH